MGGKAQRRREKNYRAAHGGESRLPPPPNLREIEAIPSKLRKIMELKSSNSSSSPKPGPAPTSKDAGSGRRKVRSAADKKKMNTKDEPSSDLTRDGIQGMKDKHITVEDSVTTPSLGNERKKKRKRKAVKDLRFQDLDQAAASTRKKKRREYLEAKKKKNKKAKTDSVLDFPGREEIKFGEVVEAPPKLSVPKRSSKSPLDAFHERVRLEAIEAYRNQKGWTSRPGVQIPMPENPSS